MHVDLDMIYDDNPAQREKNTSLLFDRVRASGANVIYLQAFADPDGNGTADASIFRTATFPCVPTFSATSPGSWQHDTNARFTHGAWYWVSICRNRPVITAVSPDKKVFYTRLTPFDAENRRIINEIYEDLASHAPFMGIIFHDDAIIGDYEDVSPAGKAWLTSMGLPDDPELIRKNPKMMQKFTRAKSRALIDFTKELQAPSKNGILPVYTARNIYAPGPLSPYAENGWPRILMTS